MPRQLHAHKTSNLNRAIEITAHDEIGTGGAPLKYGLTLPLGQRKDDGMFESIIIRFQNGPITGPQDFNGFTIEALLAIAKDKLECHQKTAFQCRENAMAITKLDEALFWLAARTRDREQRGVEGQITK